MKPIKIVIIAKNIHPYLSPRSHRATELAKELSKQGNFVTLYAILGNYDYSEYMVKTGIKIKNLGKPYFGIRNSDGKRKRTFLSKALTYLLGSKVNFPDIFLMWQTKKAIINESNFDYLITIATPYPIHWGAALCVNKNTKHFKKWTADCGDPYMLNPLFKLPFYFKYIEKWWSRKSDFITIPVKEAIAGYFPEIHNKIRVIPQGFDFENIELTEYKKSNLLQFAYSGMIYPGTRDPSIFMDYLCSLENINFKFIVYTTNKDYFQKYKLKLVDKLEIFDYIPRNELLKELSKMDFLINIKNTSILQIPSKLIDYYMTNRPIIEITSSFNEVNIFNEFLNGNYRNQKPVINISQYNISNVAQKFRNLYSN